MALLLCTDCAAGDHSKHEADDRVRSCAMSLCMCEHRVAPPRLSPTGGVALWMIGYCEGCGQPLYASDVRGLTIPVQGQRHVSCE